MAKISSIKKVDTNFSDIKQWYDNNLHPDVNAYDDQKVYEHVYSDGNFAGIFQLTSKGAQKLFTSAKPKNVVDIAVLTSIYRPGPLAAKVDKVYLEAREGKKLDWGHPLFEKVLGKTDNCVTGDTLVLTTTGEMRIDDIVEQANKQIVTLLTFNESTQEIEQDRIVAAICSGEQETVKIVTEDGELCLTKDHRVYTRRGWVTAGCITQDDEILFVSE